MAEVTDGRHRKKYDASDFCLRINVPYNSFDKFLMDGYSFDLLAKLTGKKPTVSSVRVKKFCATTEFDAKKVHSSSFKASYTLDEGLARTLEFEFVHPRTDDIQFVCE